jgi:hypothetical protein
MRPRNPYLVEAVNFRDAKMAKTMVRPSATTALMVGDPTDRRGSVSLVLVFMRE